MSDENVVQANVRLAASQMGLLLMRNNVGACRDETGRSIRYGLMNESKRINEKIKSSDLIGITPVVIQPHHIGHTFGVFTAAECKHSEWKAPSNDRERAQARFHDLVRQYGGFASFVTCDDDLKGFML